MKIALDPYMFRRVPLTDLPGLAVDLGYQYLELSPREDFLPFLMRTSARPRCGTGNGRSRSPWTSAAP
jgi:myo-inositol catabolism protein IolH